MQQPDTTPTRIIEAFALCWALRESVRSDLNMQGFLGWHQRLQDAQILVR